MSSDMDDESKYRMINVGEKKPTQRRALASGKIIVGKKAFELIRDGKLPKGDVLALSEMAGIGAAKKTSDLIPLCHPLPLDHVQVKTKLNENDYSIEVSCVTTCFGKTGVEMEALMGVQGALITIWDLSKMIEPALEIKDIRLDLKEGGKSGLWKNPNLKNPEIESKDLDLNNSPSNSSSNFLSKSPSLEKVPVSVITVSDRAYSGKYEDKSGPALQGAVIALGAELKNHSIVPDEKEKIKSQILEDIRENGSKIIFTTGGTGLSARDITPEAISEIMEKEIPGFGEILRAQGAKYNKLSWLSRSIGAVIENSIVIALPGNPKATGECVEILEPILFHALKIVSGGDHASDNDQGRPNGKQNSGENTHG